MPGKEADEGGANEEAADLDALPGSTIQAIHQETNADHLAGFECVGKREEGHGRHAPRGEVVACRNVEADLAPDRKAHHQTENRNEKKAREVAGEAIKAINN